MVKYRSHKRAIITLQCTGHGAYAFRMIAIGIGKLGSKGLSAEEWGRLRQEHFI